MRCGFVLWEVLATPAQEIDGHPLKQKAFRAGSITVQAPDYFRYLAVAKQGRLFAPAFAFHGLTGKMQLRYRFRAA